jgi:hypothetical protein
VARAKLAGDHDGGCRRGHGKTPGDVGELDGRVLRQTGELDHELAGAGPVLDAGEQERADPGGHEAGHEQSSELRRRDPAAQCDDLEQQQGRGERTADDGAQRGIAARKREDLGLGRAVADEPPRHQAERQAERDERSLRAEHEAAGERHQGRQEDAREMPEGNLAKGQSIERGMAAVAGEPQDGRDDRAAQRRYRHDEPPGRLVPPGGVG